ncbi:hypothetical protein [Oceanimonas sp. CAM02]|uniref:hypothetical protein n=1 Tax=Oceanimonas sp. CAM02 TaxID=3080336 RepID=UPI002935B99F|nr:hypothetical protein [Oceanimonas sp. CAM02]MDV2858225.1 hypothetical protein [Oceanimonas sp. CAM02]
MTEQSPFATRRAYLSKIIAPPSLPTAHRQIVFLRLAQVCTPMLTQFQQHLPLFSDHMEQRLQALAQFPMPDTGTYQQTFDWIKNQKLLTEAPYAAALCAPLHKVEDAEKFEEWLGVILLCCCQVHILGHQDSGIESALREIRQIATSAKHAPLLQFLPRATSTDSLIELGEELEVLKLKYPDYKLDKERGYLSVVIRNAAHQIEGIVRKRRVNLTFERPEVITTVPLEPADESGFDVQLLQLTPETPDSQQADEPARITPGNTLRVADPLKRKKALVVKAIQGQRLAEQLSSRQQSLPCSYNQASEWDIQHLVLHCLKQLKEQDVLAGWMLLALVTGRDPAWLHTRANQEQLLEIVDNHPSIRLTHHVPASSQPNELNPILPAVSDHFFRPLPIQLHDWVERFYPSMSPPTPSEMREWLKPINEAHKTRLTPGLIVRYLEHWLLNQGADRAIIALLRGESHKSRPALSYSHLSQDDALEHHARYVNAIFAMAEQSPGLPARVQKDSNLGSRIYVPSEILQHIFIMLAGAIEPEADIKAFHNRYVYYVWALLAFSTGHRDVTAPMGKLGDFNPYQRTWWISDKERRHGLSARTLVIPATAARQVEFYLEHLRQLSIYSRFQAPELAARCQQSLDGTGNLLFAFEDRQGSQEPADLTPSLLAKLPAPCLPWAKNWARHHLRSELAKQKVNPELIDSWMGHEEMGEEALGRHSFVSMGECRELAEVIESILKKHQIKALPGWTIR